VDLRGIDPGVTECVAHRTRGIFTSRVGLRDVRRVGGKPVAGDLRVDLRAARLRMLELLEYDDAACLAHHEPVTLAVERTTRPLRIVVAPGERAHRPEAGDPALVDRGLGAAAEHDVRPAAPHLVRAVAG